VISCLKEEKACMKIKTSEIIKDLKLENQNLRTALEALFSWVKAEAEFFEAHTPDQDMLEMIKKALKRK
jgi:hypothetical protein